MKDLSPPKLKKIAKTLDDMRGAFDDEVAKLAEKARAEILPYFKKHDFDFRAGNGTWFISKPSAARALYYRPADHVTNDELPKNIRDLLMLEITRGDYLGFYVRDINRGEW